MDEQLLKHLSIVSDEEERILSGESVDRTVYASTDEFTVDKERMLGSGRLITLRPHTRFTDFPMHSHNYIEIMYQCKGKTVHTFDDGEEVTLSAGELLLLGNGARHAIKRAMEGDIAVNFLVLPQFFDTALDMLGQDNALGVFLAQTLRADSARGAHLYFRVADVLPVQNLVENLVFSLVHRPSNRHNVDRITMGLLFMNLANYTQYIRTQPLPRYDNAQILTVLRDIEENYRYSALTELAERLGQSVSSLSSLVRRTTGSTYKQLLAQKRFMKAEALLVDTDLSIAQIIWAVGYDNTSYFHREFRRRYNMSPMAYRKLYK